MGARTVGLSDLFIVIIGKVAAAVGVSHLGSWLCYRNDVFMMYKEKKLTQ